MKNKKTTSKKFNPLQYKGYLAVLVVLFIILIILIKIAFDMIKEHYPSAFIDKTTSISVETEETELQRETFVESDNVSETESAKLESVTESETELETDREKTLEIHVDTENPLLILVNRDYPIPEGIEYTLIEISEEHFVDERMYNDLQAMLSDAKKAGYDLEICSAWRSKELQEKLYSNKLDEYLSYGYSYKEAEELAAFWVALPGTSEHEIGLAVDIVSKYYQQLDHSQADTNEQKWLMSHCHEYGFILRYPEDKQDITYIGYEPWHYRYVGKAAAAEIVEKGICLEEYLQLPLFSVKY